MLDRNKVDYKRGREYDLYDKKENITYHVKVKYKK